MFLHNNNNSNNNIQPFSPHDFSASVTTAGLPGPEKKAKFGHNKFKKGQIKAK
jgi:hypothetical protein